MEMSRRFAALPVRLLLLLGCALAAAALVAMLVRTNTVATSDDPATVAARAVVGAGGCGAQGDVLLVAPTVSAAQDKPGPFNTDGYIGTLPAAAQAFGGSVISADGEEAWLLMPAGDVARQLVRFTTPLGNDLWVRAGIVRKTGCALWK